MAKAKVKAEPKPKPNARIGKGKGMIRGQWHQARDERQRKAKGQKAKGRKAKAKTSQQAGAKGKKPQHTKLRKRIMPGAVANRACW